MWARMESLFKRFAMSQAYGRRREAKKTWKAYVLIASEYWAIFSLYAT
jgi:hypothetical protein